MELPLGGPALRHYTQSRPRPHRQKLNYRPTRPQETIIECENEDFELMGRVDEGVEEFFTKKVLPTETLKTDDDEEEEIIETITVHEVAPASAAPCPPPAKTLRRKLGDFFTLKKRRGLKSETCHEGRPKKASIADFIRPLREVARGEKDKEKVKEHDKENEKEKVKDAADTGEAVQGISICDAPPMRGEAVPPRRALREGKSQSLILLSGSSSGNTRNKKQLDGQNSFEQKLHLMLQRIGVSKPQSEETKNQEGEMKKAESEGTIIDSKPEPPSTKPRTMSASSDTRHQLRSSVSAHESAGKPPLLPKPVLKPAPSTATSGRNTPENELGQIVETEPSALTTTQSPEAVSACSTPTTATISDTAPATVVPSSTVIPTDKDICTDSVDSSVEATALTNVTESDSTAFMPEASTTTTNEQPEPTIEIEKALTSTTAPASPEPDSLNLIVTASSTITTPFITTSETVTLQSNDISTTTTADLSTEITLPEPNGAVCSATVESPKSTSILNVPAGLSDNLVTTASDELTSSALPTSESQVSTLVPDVKTKSEAPNLSDTLITVTSMISSDTTNVTSSSTITTTCVDHTTTSSETPPSTTCTISPSTLCPTHTPTVTQDTALVTSVTSNTAKMTDTIQTNTASTASPQLTSNSDLPINTALSPFTADVSAEDSDSTSDPLTTNKPSDEHSGQDHELQASPPEASTMDLNAKGTAEEVPKIQKNELIMTDESKTPSEGEKDSENKTEEPTVISCEVIMNDDKEEAEPKEEPVKTNEMAVSETEATKGRDELSGDYVMIVDQKQQESTGSDEK